MVIAALDPVIDAVVAVTTCVVPLADDVTKLTVAKPFAFVVLLAPGENDPPFVLVHATVWLAEFTGLLFASVNCAEMVTALPAGGA